MPATTEDVYETVVPTLADSNATGIHRSTFFVRAATATPGVFYDSAPDSGYSVDNLPPAAARAVHRRLPGRRHPPALGRRTPSPTSGTTGSTAASTADFMPGPGNLVATRQRHQPTWTSAPPGSYYKLSAMDVNGNESGYAALGPVGTSDVPDGGSLAFALEGVRPNPSVGEPLRVAFTLPDAAPARLDLLDVAGRRVATREVGSLGGGRHAVDLTAGAPLAPGLYLVRLTQGASVRVTRVVVLK